MSDEWGAVGRDLLRRDFEEHAERVATAFHDTSQQIEAGADLDDIDIGALRVALEQADAVLSTVEEKRSNAE